MCGIPINLYMRRTVMAAPKNATLPKKTTAPTVHTEDVEGENEKKTVPARPKPKKVKKTSIYKDRPVKYPYYKELLCINDREDHFEYIEDPFDPANADRMQELLDSEENRRFDIEYDGAITCEIAKQLLGWETEAEYEKRMLAEDPDLDPKTLKWGNEYLLKDGDNQKVKCWNNESKGYMNRPFDEGHCESLAQDILTKNWRVNLENIIVSRTGLVISGQHRLIGLVLAVEGKNGWRAKNQKWAQYWESEPVIETLVAFGCDETAEVIRSIDNVKPRSLADVFYTSPLFQFHEDGTPYTQRERNDLSKMAQFAVQLLWLRTRGDGDTFIEHMTHSAANDFLERHSKLLNCIKHIYEQDGAKPVDLTKPDEEQSTIGKIISGLLRIQRGHAAALMYLMGQSGTSPDVAEQYYQAGSPKNEKKLDWKHWDKAHEFWTLLAQQEEEWTIVVKESLAELNDPETGFAATAREKNSVIVNAWNKFKLKEEFNPEDPKELHPPFEIDETNNRRKIKPVDEPNLGGIDRGTLDEGDPDTSAITKEEVEEQKQKVKHESIMKTLDANKAPTIKQDQNKKVLPAKQKTTIGKTVLKGGTDE